jgi:carbon monoxide dehydrogenase subunit G
LAVKNNIALALVGLVLVFGILACDLPMNADWGSETVRGSGLVVEEDRDVSNVSGVELAMPGTLYLLMGSSESLRIEAEDNLLEYIETEVRAGRLVIDTRRGVRLQTTQPINYYLTVDELKTIRISSSGDVEAEDLQSKSVSVTISSSGNLSIGSLDCTSLDVDVTSSGDVAISELMAESISVRISSSGSLEVSEGMVRRQDITISSSGEYRARDLASEEAEVTLTSNGNATIRVSDHLGGRLSSSGDIYYIGSPEVNVRTTSSGRTVRINE